MDQFENQRNQSNPENHEVQAPVRKRLGRGLSSMLGGDDDPTLVSSSPTDSSTVTPSGELRHIPIGEIERNPFQPRTEFDESSLRELSESIQQHGVLQPLLVRVLPNGLWQLIAGERRWRAAQKAGLPTVPCRVLDVVDQQVCEVALEENLKRKDLNVLEKAQAFQDYLQRFGSTIEELSKQLSLDRSTVSNMLRLLELPDTVKQSLRADKISAGHARALLSLSESDRIALCERIQSESLSVRATEAVVRKLLAESKSDGETVPFDGAAKSKPEPTQHVLSLQGQLRDL